MSLFISDNNIIYLDLNDVDNDYYCTKLCFQYYSDKITAKQINLSNGNEPSYNKHKNEYCIPYDINEPQKCFLLRLVIDSIELKKGNLPLHAAAISDGKKSFVIAAGSGKGKSYISDIICESFSEYYAIGDDHIIIASNHIQGNLKRRIRNNNENTEYKNNKGLDKKHDLTFICFEFSETDNYVVELSKEDVFKYFSSVSAFKYLNETFSYNKKRFKADIMTDINVNTEYQKCLLHCLNGNNAVYICGTQKFAADYISKDIIKRRAQ